MNEENGKTSQKEWLTQAIIDEYWAKASRLHQNGSQDTGMRRKFRIELQRRCGLPEIEAINILTRRIIMVKEKAIHIPSFLKQHSNQNIKTTEINISEFLQRKGKHSSSKENILCKTIALFPGIKEN